MKIEKNAICYLHANISTSGAMIAMEMEPRSFPTKSYARNSMVAFSRLYGWFFWMFQHFRTIQMSCKANHQCQMSNSPDRHQFQLISILFLSNFVQSCHDKL